MESSVSVVVQSPVRGPISVIAFTSWPHALHAASCPKIALDFPCLFVSTYVCIFVCPHLSHVGITSSISSLSQSHVNVVASMFPLLLSIHLEIVTVLDYSC